jgi:hypothetical protein
VVLQVLQEHQVQVDRLGRVEVHMLQTILLIILGIVHNHHQQVRLQQTMVQSVV